MRFYDQIERMQEAKETYGKELEPILERVRRINAIRFSVAKKVSGGYGDLYYALDEKMGFLVKFIGIKEDKVYFESLSNKKRYVDDVSIFSLSDREIAKQVRQQARLFKAAIKKKQQLREKQEALKEQSRQLTLQVKELEREINRLNAKF